MEERSIGVSARWAQVHSLTIASSSGTAGTRTSVISHWRACFRTAVWTARFGEGGSVIVDVGAFDSLSAVLPVCGGTLTAGTTSQRAGDRSGRRELVVLRTNEAGDRDGQLVPGSEGDASTLDISGGSQDSVYAAAMRGRSIVLAGGTSPDDFATGDAYVAQLTPEGVLDPAFGGGIQTLRLGLEYTSFLGATIRRGGRRLRQRREARDAAAKRCARGSLSRRRQPRTELRRR